MVPKELTEDLRTRFSTLNGQMKGILTMLEKAEPDFRQILTQFEALEKGVQKARLLLMDDVLRKALALRVVSLVDACPGT